MLIIMRSSRLRPRLPNAYLFGMDRVMALFDDSRRSNTNSCGKVSRRACRDSLNARASLPAIGCPTAKSFLRCQIHTLARLSF